MATTTTYGVDLRVELGIGLAEDAALWGSGLWKVDRWGDTDTTTGDWVDVTCDVVDGVRLAAGSNTDDGVTRRWESAGLAFTLDGPTWDPWNGPHAGVVGDRTPVRMSWRPTGEATWRPAFTGFIATRGYTWDPDDQSAEVACVDGTSVLVAADTGASPAQGAGETAAARVARVAAWALWPGPLDVTAGGVAVQATTLEAPAWSELLEVADTDLGLLWVTRAGALAYRPRGRVGPGTHLEGRLTVCPDLPADVQVVTLGAAQPSVSRNRVWVARRKTEGESVDPPVAYREDRQSVARFQSQAFTRTDLWHVPDTWSGVVADAVLGGGAWPSAAPGAAELDTITGDDRVGAVLLALEPDMTYDVVDDSGRVWREAVIGWDVEVGHTEAVGRLDLEDVTRWAYPGLWGTAVWGVDQWGIGGVS